MNRYFQSSKTLIILFSTLVLLGLVVAYTTLIHPKTQEKELLSSQLTNLKNDTLLLEKQIDGFKESEDEEHSDSDLRKKLPKDRELDELLRTLKIFERTSNVRIQEVSFLQYDSSSNDSTEGTSNSFTDGLLSAIGIQKNEENPQDEPQLPEQLRFITFKVEIEVKDVEHLLKFITEIENEKRIIRIEKVSFSQSQEEKPEDAKQSFLSTLQLTTYYFKDEAN